MATPAAILSILVQADGIAKTQNQIRGLDSDLEKAGKTGTRTGGAIKKAAGIVGGIVAFDTLRRGVGAAIGEFEEARKVGAQTTNVIKSTGGAANVTAKHVATLASSISKKVGIDDEAIQSGSNLLLTFKNVSNEVGRGNKVFDRATKAAVDLSAAGFGDLSSTSKQLGKALNDPIKGLTALTRSGVTFTEQQKLKIESLVEEGKTLKAQKIILREVESQVQGSAAAQATALDKAKVAVGNLAEAAGSVLVPAFDKAATIATKFINGMIESKGAGGALISVFRTTGTVIGAVVGSIATLVGWFKQHQTVSEALAATIGVLAAAMIALQVKALVTMIPTLAANTAAWIALNAAMLLNPAVLIVVGLAALAAALVVAYNESATFRKIVDAAWNDVLKPFASWLGKAAVAAFYAVRDAVKSAWTTIRNVTTTVWGAIDAYVKGIWEALKLAATIYFTVYKTIITTAWTVIKTATKVIWDAISAITTGAWDVLKTTATIAWELIKLAILTPIRAVRDIIGGKDGIWEQIKGVAKTAWEGIKTVIDKAAEPILDVILAPFKAAVKGVAKFAKLILQVVGKIPGVDTGGPVEAIDKFVSGLATGGVFQAFARGGAFARTGGVVSKPITLMGEEAPRHPEFVIPTNPAYRKRAQSLALAAGQAVGLARGGKYDRDFGQGSSAMIPFDAAAQLAEAAGLPGITYAQIAIGESGLRPGAVSSDGGYGLWQMTPRVQSRETVLAWNKIGSYFNPWNNAQQAKVLAGAGTGVSNYYGTSNVTDWNKHYTGSTEGYIPSGFSTGTPNLNPLDLIKHLPGIGDLPGWLQGTGKWVLDKAGDFIKSKVGGVLGESVPGWGVLDRLAQSFGVPISSTYRSDSSTYHGQLLGVSGRARATDYSNGTGPTPQMLQLAQAMASQYGSELKELFYTPLGFSIKDGQKVPWFVDGHYNHVHAAFRKGGAFGGLPYVGAYANGGVVPQTGMAMVHRGETITPAGSVPEVHVYIGDRELTDLVRVEIREDNRRVAGTYRAGVA